ncbi:MAG: hypothetical protein ACK4MV_20855 [Beijerinckiaceae bacterium]
MAGFGRAIFAIFIAASSPLAAASASAQTAAILIPGAGGPVPIDFLMRNRSAFARAGVETFVATSPQEVARLSQKLKAGSRRVVIVGMSRGGVTAAGALAAGARVDGVVLVSTSLDLVRQRIGSPSRLPPALVVHHRNDGCGKTRPQEVPGFVAWSGGRARVAWVDTRGPEAPNPCGPRGAHGFYMQDGPAVSAILSFVR